MSSPFKARLESIPRGPCRDEFLPLLFLADDSETQVRSYYQQGDLLVLRADDGTTLGMTLLIPQPDGAVELKSVAVVPHLQGRGVGRQLLDLALSLLRARGVRRVTVGTANCDVGELAFYQKAGFRLWQVERDFFSSQRGYAPGIAENGIPLLDMVWMDREL